MHEIFGALDLKQSPISITGKGDLPSRFCVTDLAVSSQHCVASAMTELMTVLSLTKAPTPITLNRRLASLWFSFTYQPIGWDMPSSWDEIAGDYKTHDGWIKLHTNLPHHKAAALSVLKVENNRDEVARVVSQWGGEDLETAIVDAGGVCAKMRSRTEWSSHQQGKAVAKEPLIHWDNQIHTSLREWQPTRERPLQGLKVLDLTRVLAGPVATRALAGFGAQVLRIDPKNWDENIVVPEVTLGKQCAYLDLKKPEGLERFEQLLGDADILIHGYRPGALDGMCLGKAKRQAINPGLIEISLDAYGWSGPWATRRGFDSLVQMSCGIAQAGMVWANAEKPTPLPVQALDFATGYIMAASAIRSLTMALKGERKAHARLSLARTAELLIAHPQEQKGEMSLTLEDHEFKSGIEKTPWGDLRRLNVPFEIKGTPMHWDSPACKFGSAKAHW